MMASPVRTLDWGADPPKNDSATSGVVQALRVSVLAAPRETEVRGLVVGGVHLHRLIAMLVAGVLALVEQVCRTSALGKSGRPWLSFDGHVTAQGRPGTARDGPGRERAGLTCPRQRSALLCQTRSRPARHTGIWLYVLLSLVVIVGLPRSAKPLIAR